MNTPRSTEAPHMDEVNVHDSGPTEVDEMDVLKSLYPYDEETGTFSVQVGDPNE